MKELRNEHNTLKYHLMVYERFLITDALRKTNGNCSRAAEVLGTTERVIGSRIRKYEIDYRQFRKKKPNRLHQTRCNRHLR